MITSYVIQTNNTVPEVFKRVGFTTVNFENFQGKPQNVEVQLL